jgi:hypothetical protein
MDSLVQSIKELILMNSIGKHSYSPKVGHIMSKFKIRTCFTGAASNISSRDLHLFPSEA